MFPDWLKTKGKKGQLSTSTRLEVRKKVFITHRVLLQLARSPPSRVRRGFRIPRSLKKDSRRAEISQGLRKVKREEWEKKVYLPSNIVTAW